MSRTRLPRRTELNITEVLVEELRKRGINLEIELSYPVLKGRKQPDAVLKDGGEYYLETELGPQTKLIDGLLQGQDYVKTLQGTGAFVVLFPDEWRRPMPREVLEKLVQAQKCSAVATFSDKDPRTPQRFEGTLSQVADWITRDVLKPIEIPEPDTSLTIATLRDAVEYLSASLLSLQLDEIEDVFGGITVFENILQFEKGSYPISELRKAATYLLVNQILFYHVLSQIEKDRFPLLDETRISVPGNLLRYFRKVLEFNYTPTFGFDVASKIPKSATDVVRKVVSAIKVLKPEKIRYDLLGKVFHELIPFEDRKYVAAFYTNNEAAELLASLVVEKPDDKVADLACGSGTLLVAAYHQKRRLVESAEGTLTAKHHRQFLEKNITGIDIMPFAAHLAVVHLSLQAPLYQTERARIAIWDSTQLRPGKTIPAIAKELMESYKQSKLESFMTTDRVIDETKYVKKGVVAAGKMRGEEVQLEPVDVVIMNPPFTRQERLPKEYKERLENSLSNYRSYFHGQLGLHGYFIFLADSFLKENGRLALVLPTTVLRVQSMQTIREFLSRNYVIEYIITAWKKLAFSESAWFREILLVARKTAHPNPDESCLLITLDKLPKDNLQAIQIAQKIKEITKGEHGESGSKWFKVVQIPQNELKQSVDNWFKHIAVYDHSIEELWENIQGKPQLIEFSRLRTKKNAEVIRGAETKSAGAMPVQAATILSAADRMRRSGYEWVAEETGARGLKVVNKLSNEHTSIPLSSLLPAFVTPSGVGAFELGDETDYIVAEAFANSSDFFHKIDQRKLPTLLREWKRYVKERQGTMLISRRVVLPVPGFVHMCYHSKKPVVGPGIMWVLKNLPDEDSKILTLWMNSTFHIAQVLVEKIEDVWINIHQYALDQYKVLDPDALEKTVKKNLLALYDRLAKVKFPSFEEQIVSRFSSRAELDSAILEILGFEASEINQRLDKLYRALEREFAVMKEFMKQAGDSGVED
jgi:methylase of polypeptide subunit release factors